ncbi:MAG: ATP-binding protein, partial [Thermodesulfobacteriota bacterium]
SEKRFPAEIETTCYRIVQEGITNIIRHAEATFVDVTLRLEAERLWLFIKDNGKGFDVQQARLQSQAGKCIGLLGMEERTHLVGGRLEISSSPGKGSEIRAWIPLCKNVP